MRNQDLIRGQLDFVHSALEGTMADFSEAALHKNFDGATISNCASIYAHAVFSEDGIVNGMLQGKQPLFHAQSWGSKLSVQMPSRPTMDLNWGQGVKMDLPAFQQYAKAVYANSDAYIAGLSDADFERKIETGYAGQQSVAWVLGNVLATHAPMHNGEIAALKGIQGLKGLPF